MPRTPKATPRTLTTIPPKDAATPPAKKSPGKTPGKRTKAPMPVAAEVAQDVMASATPPAYPLTADERAMAPLKSRARYGKRADHAKPREQALKALALYKLGLNYDQIAAHLGLKWRRQAWEMVNNLLRSYEVDGVREARLVAGERLMDLFYAVMPAALNGDSQAIGHALAIHDRYARLYGLNIQPNDAPTPDGAVTITIIPRADEPRVVDMAPAESFPTETPGAHTLVIS